MSMSPRTVGRLLFRLLAEAGAVEEDHDEEVHEGEEGHEEEEEDHEEEDHADAESAADVVDKPWGSIIGAALVVQSVTLIGLVVVAGMALYRQRTGGTGKLRHHRVLLSLIPSFAAGALIATVVFLIVPESIALLGSSESVVHEEEEHDEDHAAERWRLLTGVARRFLQMNETITTTEEEVGEHHDDEEEDHTGEELAEDAHADEAPVWKFGVFFFVGFMIPLLIGAFFPTTARLEDMVSQQEEQAPLTETKALANAKMIDEVQVDDDDEPIQPASVNKKKDLSNSIDGGSTVPNDDEVIHIKDLPLINPQLASSILIGDFLHNFADGIFIGTAFLLCDSSLAWTLAATTVYHELAQEISDFMLLTEFCNFSIVSALAANFLAGFSVVIGAVIVATVDFSNVVVGCILAVSAGVYMYIAVAECIPKMFGKTRNQRLSCLLFFALGAIPIGLVLLNHTHCEAGHDEH
jgi:zinc transporter ZupT